MPDLVAIVSELNNRVTAEAFIREELNNVRRAITQVPRQTLSLDVSSSSSNSFPVSDIATTTRISQLSLRENVAREVQIGLKALTVSGTERKIHTVSGLISHYMEYLRAELRVGSVEAARVVVDEAEIALIDQINLLLGGFAKRTLPADIGNTTDILRGTTNQIPQINTITNQSQSIVRQFDFELINLIRELEDLDRDTDQSVWARKFEALQESASTVLTTLETRKLEIGATRDLEAQSTAAPQDPTPISRVQAAGQSRLASCLLQPIENAA